MNKSFPPALFNDVIRFAIVNKMEGLAEHVVNNSLLPLLSDNLHLILGKSLIVEFNLIGLFNDFSIFS